MGTPSLRDIPDREETRLELRVIQNFFMMYKCSLCYTLLDDQMDFST